MTRKRRDRKFKEWEVLLTAVRQGGIIPCRCCEQPITEQDILSGNVEKEHIHERGLDGPDDPYNCAYSHAAPPCHATVTHGNGATWAGSSRHKIAKATEPERIEKFRVRKDPPKPREKKLDADRVSLPSGRCRGCGGPPGECSCAPKPQRSGFGQRRAA